MIILKLNREQKIRVTWRCNKWISFKFFEDAIKFLDLNSEITQEINFLIKTKIDTLNLTRFPEAIEEFKVIIENVIQYNKETQGADMHDPSYFQVYFDKLLELKKMFYETYGFSEEEE